MTQVKVGDKVRLKVRSSLYYQAPGETGTIVEYPLDGDTTWCEIKFPSLTDGYPTKDLIVVSSIAELQAFKNKVMAKIAGGGTRAKSRRQG